MKNIIREETIIRKRTIYKQSKKVHCRPRYKGSCRKIKRYTEEEKVLYKIEKALKFVQKINELINKGSDLDGKKANIIKKILSVDIGGKR